MHQILLSSSIDRFYICGSRTLFHRRCHCDSNAGVKSNFVLEMASPGCNECRIIVFYAFDDILMIFEDIEKGLVLLQGFQYAERVSAAPSSIWTQQMDSWKRQSTETPNEFWTILTFSVQRRKLCQNRLGQWSPMMLVGFLVFTPSQKVLISICSTYHDTPARRDRTRQFRGGIPCVRHRQCMLCRETHAAWWRC